MEYLFYVVYLGTHKHNYLEKDKFRVDSVEEAYEDIEIVKDDFDKYLIFGYYNSYERELLSFGTIDHNNKTRKKGR